MSRTARSAQRVTPRRTAAALAAAAALAVGLAGCGGGSSGSGSSKKITVTYQQFGGSHIQQHFLQGVAKQYQKAHPGTKIDLEPITASEDDYYTKLQLQMRSKNTSPDVVYEDTFLINSDIKAGYLSPLDKYLDKWSDWKDFAPTAKTAAKALDGKTYGVPDGTDTRALWYNKDVFTKAGLPTDWQPKTWDDVLAAAKAIKAKVPGVVPLNVYAGTGVGEAASMQGFEMLLYGTKDSLYNKGSKKWVVGSPGFTDALDFEKTVFTTGLGPSAKQALDPNWGNTVSQQLLPKDGVGIDLDGSWISGNWLAGGATPWSQWSSVMGTAAMPTQRGTGRDKVSLSGGWTYAIPKNSDNASGAWSFIKLVTDKENELKYDIAAVQIPVRKDVAADSAYTKANPTNAFFASLVPITQYRPAYAIYPQVSKQIQTATESVVTGQASPAAAAKTYDSAVKGIVGGATTTSSGS